MRKYNLSIVMAVLAFAVSGAERIMNGGGQWSDGSWTTRSLWLGQTYANNGDIAHLSNGTAFRTGKKFDMNCNGITLSGLDFNTLIVPIYSASKYSITMVGNRPFLSGSTTTKTQVELPIKGQDSNVLRREGLGEIVFQTPVEGFSRFEIWQGTVVTATNATVNPAIAKSGTDIVLCGGIIKVAGKDPGQVAEMLSLKIGSGVGRLYVDNNATLTIDSLEREVGGVAVFNPQNGKILVKNRESDAANEIDGSIVTMDTAASPHGFEFLEYDATSGFVQAGAGTPLQSGVDVNGIADVAASMTLTANTKVGALRLSNSATLTLAEGVTLTVGDGAHPAGVIFQNSATADSPCKITGAGTLAFGDQEGIFWLDNANNSHANARNYAFDTKVTGTKGVIFAAYRPFNNTDNIPLITMPIGYVAGWTGPTRVANAKLTAGTANFASGSDIYIDGNADTTSGSGQLVSTNCTWTQTIHLSGKGLSSSASGETLYMNRSGTTKFSQPVKVDSDVRIGVTGTMITQFDGGLAGTGGISIEKNTSNYDAGSVVRIYGASDYSGETKFSGSYLMIKAPGSLGLGKVTSTAGRINYDGLSNVVIPNDFEVSSCLQFCNSTVDLNGALNAASFRLYKQSQVAITNLTAKRIQADAGTVLKGYSAGSMLTVGEDTKTNAIVCALEDGNGRLSLVKTGTGTVQLFGKKSYTGETEIRNGTLQLLANLTNSSDVVYWLDAADADSVAVDQGSGRVTSVLSHNRNGFSFGKHSSFGMPFYCPANGDQKASFSFRQNVETKSDACVLLGSSSVHQRTVFVVAKPEYFAKGSGNAGLFGAYGRDLGARVSAANGNFHSDWSNSNGASYTSSNGFRVNGKLNDTTGKSTPEMLVISMVHDTDNIAGQYSSFSDFQPVICGYATWGDKNNGFLCYNGNVYEVIGFNRVLSADEIKAVENYLSEKWLGRKLNDGAASIEELAAASAENVLPTTAEVSLFKGARLDLNGISQTVGSLSGEGEIVNSSSKPATLTVTGAITFRGEIGAGVTLVKGGAGEETLDVHVAADAAVGATDGTLKLTPYSEGPITNNLAFWIDASYKPDEMIQRDENGGITNWISRMGTVSNFYFKSNHQYCKTKPTYSESSYGGKGAVRFTSGTCALYPSKTCNLRTVFVVTRALGGGGLYVFGADTRDLGFRANADTIYVHGIFCFNPVGTLFHVNNVDLTDYRETQYYSDFTKTTMLVGTSESWQSDYLNYNCNWMLGCNMNSNGLNQDMAEILCYSVRLTDMQIAQVEDYLMKKWGIVSGSVVTHDKALDTGAGLSLGGNGIFDAQGEAVTLSTFGGNGGKIQNYSSLEVTDGFVFPVSGGTVGKVTIDGNLTIGSQAVATILNGDTLDRAHPVQTALEVKGTVTGELATAEGLPEKWSWKRAGDKLWTICKTGMLLLVR